MPWHAFTFDGLDTALADAEFAEQVNTATTTETAPTVTDPGVITQVNTPLVSRFMETVTPYIQKAVTAGVTDAVTSVKQEYKQKMLIGTIAAGGVVVLALAFLWKMSSRLQECCPARSRPVSGCCE